MDKQTRDSTATEEHRRQCLAQQRGACTGTPLCRQCGTIEQALVLAGWVQVGWAHARRAARPS
jgi:hypothetical protein